jgi:AcrR family transcriptional regulator
MPGILHSEVPNRAVPPASNRDEEPTNRRGPRGRSGTPKRSQRLTPEVIVAGAIRVADADGLDAVTVRRLADELGSRPATLYRHVASKADLLALMMDRVVGEMLVDKPLPEDWREALGEIARNAHGAYAAHPWVLQAWARGARLGPNALQHARQQARAVSPIGVPAEEVWTIIAIVDDFVIGNAHRVVTRGSPRRLEHLLSPGDLAVSPELAALPKASRASAAKQRFEIGLQALLDGVEAQFVTQPAQARADRRPANRRRP